MFTKVLILATTVVAVCARYGHHGHAYSSLSIVRHEEHKHQPTVHLVAAVHHVASVHEPVAPIYYAQKYHGGSHHEEKHHDYYAHPKYEFEYKVDDPYTKDYKYQHESRDGDAVKGVYSLHEADGTVRVIKYTADTHKEFNAKVHHEGRAKHGVSQMYEHHY